MKNTELSLRRYLLLGILVPVLGFVLVAGAGLYRAALQAADLAYDRTLLATAKMIGEHLQLREGSSGLQVHAEVPYSALEAFEADNRSRLFYRVLGPRQDTVSGFAEMPLPRPDRSGQPAPYAALVHFYDEIFQGQRVRMAVLLQPVAGPQGYGMATIQVAETLELRHALARQLLLDMLGPQALLVLLIAGVVVLVVQRATRPVRQLSQQLQARAETDLSPLPSTGLPRELRPVVEASNQLMHRLSQVLEHQKRFVRDASHQLRTPLAVLKTQLQSARRGDVEPQQALQELEATVDGATTLANQMLALAKVEQLRQQGLRSPLPVQAWDEIVRAVALDVSPLIADRGLDFGLHTEAAPVRAHEWALRELVRNLLHNAVKHSPAGATLDVALQATGGQAVLTVADAGPGLAPERRERLFQPFAAGLAQGPAAETQAGSGLGLAICQEIVASLGGTLALNNRPGRGLEAVVRLPQAALP
ncbi:sensor histidine kinase [Rubrivivax rivuli]|uniref:histidine kinase n=2 Tax=Rubrivivax rivuli TaxID=1862385 RepID=A0A437RIM7_9BURK|nr:sensor histidine kinase [Rubrivivax rivuli]